NVDLRMGIGIESVSDGFRVASGPVSAVSQHCAAWVELAPGTIEKNAVAKQVFFALQKKSNGSFPSGVLDEVLGCLPNGKSRLVEKSGDIHA
ncbi:MAG: hypothetical protein Q7R47_00790, partial [Candidatus Diapherotrites archaeon]|nr:hypothetical protein [Candidatus Diapherotrites archaeon]